MVLVKRHRRRGLPKRRVFIVFVSCLVCIFLCKGLLSHSNVRKGYFQESLLDSVVLGTIPKGPIRFLYYDNVLTLCDCPYLPQGVIDTDNYASTLLLLLLQGGGLWKEGNVSTNSNRPWEAIYAMPGISHARTNLACLLQEATILGAIAVLPALCLSPIHNNNHRLIRTHWSRYLYINKLQQGFPIVWNVSLLENRLQELYPEYADIPFPLRWSCIHQPKYSLLTGQSNSYPSIAIFSETTPTEILQQSKADIMIRQFQNTNQEYMVCSSFKHIPSKAVKKIQNVWSYFWSSAETDPLPAVQYIQQSIDPKSEKFICLHLRRGDKLKEPRYPCLDVFTRGPHIHSVLRNASVPCGMKIYVLSNENETLLDQILLLDGNRNPLFECEYRWIYRQHIPYLQQPKYIQDNYLLYETEKRICQYAVGYVETHRTNSNYQHLQPWNLRLTPYEEECTNHESPECSNLNCTLYNE